MFASSSKPRWGIWQFLAIMRATVYGTNASAQESAGELARKVQDPLADITALFTHNAVGFSQLED